MQLIRPIEMLKNIQKNVKSHRVSDTNRVAQNSTKRPLREKSIVIMHERDVSSQWLVDMLENINIVN